MEIKTRTRKWGNSIAVILPKIFVESNKIKEDEDVVIEIKSKPELKELFGKFPEWKSKKTAQQIKDEMRKGW